MSTQRAPNENEDELSLDSGGEETTGGGGGPNGSSAGAGIVDAVDDTIMDNVGPIPQSHYYVDFSAKIVHSPSGL